MMICLGWIDAPRLVASIGAGWLGVWAPDGGLLPWIQTALTCCPLAASSNGFIGQPETIAPSSMGVALRYVAGRS